MLVLRICRTPHATHAKGTPLNITDELIKAYFSTEYRIFSPTGILVLPGRGYSAELTDIHHSFNVFSSAFITAYNPHSEQVDDATNQLNQSRLITQVSKQWLYLQGEAVDISGQWPTEPSILVLGINLSAALELGDSFQQHAVLFALNDKTNLYACRPENEKFFADDEK